MENEVGGALGSREALTIRQAAATTGWSPRMLRYIEEAGLVAPLRSAGGYRLYGPAELQRLQALREILSSHNVGLSEMSFARRLLSDASMRADVDRWLESSTVGPDDVAPGEWLAYEQQKHAHLVMAGATGTDKEER